jgi:hypothetical protein
VRTYEIKKKTCSTSHDKVAEKKLIKSTSLKRRKKERNDLLLHAESSCEVASETGVNRERHRNNPYTWCTSLIMFATNRDLEKDQPQV